LEKDGVVIEGEQNLLDHATKYYKELFGPEPGNDFRLDPEIWEGCAKISDDDNRILCQAFSEAEIKTALFQMEKNKAPGPDKMPIEFYQCCWDIVKYDIVHLFNDFHDSKTDISRLNYGIITLLPKIKDALKSSSIDQSAYSIAFTSS
jgi:mannosylglycoprotein endo-beta-mannosidase